MNQQASKMEIDQNSIRGTDPNFQIDISALPVKTGGLPVMTSLSGGYEPNSISPMKNGQILNHTTQGNSLAIAGGTIGQSQYVGSSKVCSSTGNYQTIQLTQDNDHGKLGMFSTPTTTTNKGKPMF